MSKDYIIGIDTGTSVVKAVLFDLECVEKGFSTENTPVENPHEGWSEFDLNEDWKNVVYAIRKLIQKTKVDPNDILAICVTGKGWGCCYLDENYLPARKGILWNDARSANLIEEWQSDGTLSECFKISGNYYYTGDCGPISRWLLENEPETVKRTKTVIFPSGWIAYKLTGIPKLIHGDSSSLFNMEHRSYSDNIFELLGIKNMRNMFPDTVPCTQIVGGITKDAAVETGLKKGTPVVLAEVDVSSCATGVGVIEPGDVCIILGTAHIISICLNEPIFDPETGLQMTYVDRKYLKLVPPVIATPNVDWFLKNFCHSDFDNSNKEGVEIFSYLDEKLKSISPGSDGIIYHPFLSLVGERCPFTKLTAKGNFFGMSLNHTRHHLLRAIYEGVAYSAFDCLSASKARLRRIMLSGGGAKSNVWAEIEADVLGKSVMIPSGEEFGAKGAAITGLVALGHFPDHKTAIKNIIKPERVFEPNTQRHNVYYNYFELYKSIIKHLWTDWDSRAAILNRDKN